MSELLLQPTSTAHWHALVNEAEALCSLQLNEELESYLVFLLMRFVQKPEMVNSILALEFLKGIHAHGSIRSDRLRDVGDKCLIFSGLFPGIAKRRRLHHRYFIDLGQNAYYVLAGLSQQELANMYNCISEQFEAMRNVLEAMRGEAEIMPKALQALLMNCTSENLQANAIHVVEPKQVH